MTMMMMMTMIRMMMTMMMMIKMMTTTTTSDDDRTMEEITNFKYTHGTAAAARIQYSIKRSVHRVEETRRAMRTSTPIQPPVTLDSKIKINQDHGDAKPTSGHSKPTSAHLNDVPNKSSNTRIRSTKLTKMLKTIVNGAGVLQYISIKSLTPLGFYSMFPIWTKKWLADITGSEQRV